MSTETVTSEKIIIHSGDKHNAEIRKALQNYLLQFVHSASIESASNLNLQLKIDDAVLLNLNGESCSGRNATPWQTNAATTDAISQITEDCEVEVTLHFDLFQWYSETVAYGVHFWAAILEESSYTSVTYRGLEYYDTDSEIQIFRFENGRALYKGDEVSESEVADILSWYTYNFELTLDADEDFTEYQLEKMKMAGKEIEHLFGSEKPFDFDESEIRVFSSLTLKSVDIPIFRAFLNKVLDLAEDADASIDFVAEFVPDDINVFAALYFVVENGKAKTQFVRF